MRILPALQRLAGGFVRRTWLVTLAAMMVCAVFAARAVAAYVEADHLTMPPVSPPRVPQVKPAPRPAAIDPDVLSERNIFCSDCVLIDGDSGEKFTGHPAVLIATSLGAKPRATVRVIPTEAQGSWGIEETIPGVGRIARIGGGSIDVIDGAGKTKQLKLLEPAAGQGGGAATPDAGPAAPADPFANRVKKLSDGSYEVERDVVRELVAMGGQNQGVRAVPVFQKGEIKGLRFLGVKSTSIAAAIGLKSNDVLGAIDGEPIKTAQQLLDIYSKLDKLGGVELQGTRAGKPLVVSLRFR
jgi:hypothetical protein